MSNRNTDWNSPEMTQKMIEAGIRALGSDDDRSTPEKVLDIWQAMNAAALPPRQEYAVLCSKRHHNRMGATLREVAVFTYLGFCGGFCAAVLATVVLRSH